MLRRLDADYRPKSVVVTENGAAFSDPVASDGRVHDAERVDFLRAHLEQVVKARAAGLHVDGYFAWSLMDNFEWAEGYTLRYGIVHVDFETQQRTPKDRRRRSSWSLAPIGAALRLDLFSTRNDLS